MRWHIIVVSSLVYIPFDLIECNDGECKEPTPESAYGNVRSDEEAPQRQKHFFSFSRYCAVVHRQTTWVGIFSGSRSWYSIGHFVSLDQSRADKNKKPFTRDEVYRFLLLGSWASNLITEGLIL